ncbi:hypothetical protein BDM02DRAFT_3099625 [Thelephora ganbajun]|uniref:Uncharacterized protein n=1 Tax=Thelephora ganbajun TaxID=370292 RepID=A0ACB6ZB35_THEGA|nr:hypothetical protein BDM02DRAFT_3099625 [Thelephora ganbajun]
MVYQGARGSLARHVSLSLKSIRLLTPPQLWKIVDRLDGVESRGIERVLPNERNHTQRLSDCMWMWLAANTTTATFALGTLGASVFDLGFRPTVLTIIFFNLLSTIPVAYFSTFGPKLGLRQLTLSRFSFSLYFPNCIPIILNVIACVGWSTINCITGALTLRAVSEGNQTRIPSAAAIVIIAVLTLVPSFIGYRYVHAYERYSWIPMAIIFFIVLGLSAKYFDAGSWGDASSNVTAASVLSFGSAVVGFGLGWSSLAADYTVNFPEDVSSIRVFIWTYVGLNVPLILLETFGAAMMTTLNSSAPRFAERYAKDSIGGLLGAALQPAGGFGQFCLVVLAFGIVANNIPNMYSLALTTQALHPWLQAIPRPFICIIGTIVYIILAVVGVDHFESWLDTLLVLLSYWLAIYCTIVIEEHLIFRRGKWANYDPDGIADWRTLPVGIAAFVALGAGVAGFVLGMSQVWYVGVLAKKVQPKFGGDIGFELAAAFSGIVYPIARYIEKKKFGR